MKLFKIKELEHLLTNNQLKDDLEVTLEGWVKTNRDNKNFGFISLTDGSSLKSVQIVYKGENIKNLEEVISARTGAAIVVIGKIVLTPTAKQPYEILATEVKLLKQASEDFPLQKKKHTNEFLREIADLRPRTNLFANIMRVRAMLYHIINQYFMQHDYVWVATPVVTTNDAEGAGECFKLAPIDKENFFGTEAVLSVTGQLHLEAYAMAFKDVYTFGPQFRAEKSHTNRHAAEFWMLEAEKSFCDIYQLMDAMEDMLCFFIKEYMERCRDEIDFFNEFVDTTLKAKLSAITQNKFTRVSYTEVIDLLLKAKANGHQFENANIVWGMDLDSEHERYICEQVFNGPTFVYNYPAAIKAFYMKLNDDAKTVAGVDLLVPSIGELCGGSEREANYETLLKKANDAHMDINPLSWYLELRKYGYYKSAGFGLGFERLIMYLTGVNNIRDVIPFPRTHGNAKF